MEKESILLSQSSDPKVAYIILLISHCPELSHMITSSCEGGQEISTLPRWPYAKLKTLLLCRIRMEVKDNWLPYSNVQRRERKENERV